MPKKKKINVGKGLRGCFSTVVGRVLMIIITGGFIAVAISIYPDFNPYVVGFTALLVFCFLAEFFSLVVGIFTSHAEDDDSGTIQ